MVRQIPLDVIASWPIPNYTNPETRGNSILVVFIVLLSFCVPLVCLRIWTRWHKKRWLGLDDLFCVLALVFSAGYTAVVLLAVYRYGCNRHFWDAPISLYEPNFKLAMASKVLFVCATFSIRQSLICFYQRLVGAADIKSYVYVLWAATAINTGAAIAFIPTAIFVCTPISGYWDYVNGQNAKCLNDGVITFSSSTIIATLDLLTVLLPIPLISRLQMTWSRKVGVIILLSLGTCATAAAGVRVYFIWKSLIGTYDESWYAYPLWLAGAVELNLAIICSCAAPLRPWFTKNVPWLGKFFSSLGSLVLRLYSKLASSHSTTDSTVAISAAVHADGQMEKEQWRPTSPKAVLARRRSPDAERHPTNFILSATNADDEDDDHSEEFDHVAAAFPRYGAMAPSGNRFEGVPNKEIARDGQRQSLSRPSERLNFEIQVQENDCDVMDLTPRHDYSSGTAQNRAIGAARQVTALQGFKSTDTARSTWAMRQQQRLLGAKTAKTSRRIAPDNASTDDESRSIESTLGPSVVHEPAIVSTSAVAEQSPQTGTVSHTLLGRNRSEPRRTPASSSIGSSAREGQYTFFHESSNEDQEGEDDMAIDMQERERGSRKAPFNPRGR